MIIAILNFVPVTLFYLFGWSANFVLAKNLPLPLTILIFTVNGALTTHLIISHLGTSSSPIYITQNINHALLAEDLLFKTPMMRHITYENYANCDKLAVINNGCFSQALIFVLHNIPF